MKKTQVSNSKKGIKSTSPKNESTRTSLPIDPSWCRLFDEFVHDNGKELHDEQVKDLIQTTRDLLFSDDWQIQSNSLKNISLTISRLSGPSSQPFCTIVIFPILSQAYFTCIDGALRSTIASILNKAIDKFPDVFGTSIESCISLAFTRFLERGHVTCIFGLRGFTTIFMSFMDWKRFTTLITCQLDRILDSLAPRLHSAVVNIQMALTSDAGSFATASPEIDDKMHVLVFFMKSISILIGRFAISNINCSQRVDVFLESGLPESHTVKLLYDASIRVCFNEFQQSIGSAKNSDALTSISATFTRDCQFMGGMLFASILNMSTQPHLVSTFIHQTFFTHGSKLYALNLDGYAKLAFIRGIISSMRLPIILASKFLNHSYQIILDLTKASVSQACRIMAFETMGVWLEKFKQSISQPASALSEFDNTDKGDNVDYVDNVDEIVETMIELTWLNWEDPVEALQYKVQAIFKTALDIILLRNQQTILHTFVETLVHMDSHRRVKYDLLSLIIPHVDVTSTLVERYPKFLDSCLEVMKSRNVSTRINSMVRVLLEKYRQEQPILWETFWIGPVGRALSHSDSSVRNETANGILPTVLSISPTSIEPFLKALTEDRECLSDPLYKFNAVIAATKTGRQMDALSTLDLNLVTPMLYHHDSRLRVDAFGLVCETRKGTSDTTVAEMELVKQFVVLNMISDSSEFRQRFYGYFKKFLIRMKNVLYNQWRDYQAFPNSPMRDEWFLKITEKRTVLFWLCQLTMSSLYPGAPFPRITMALRMLCTIIEVFGVDDIPIPETFIPATNERRKTFSAFPFRMSFANRPEYVQTLLNMLTVSFEAHRKTCMEILKQFTAPFNGYEDKHSLQSLIDRGINGILSIRADAADGGACILRLVFSKYVKQLGWKIDVLPMRESGIVETDSQVYFLNGLLDLLERQMDVARENLLVASQEYPLHGACLALSMVFEEVDYAELNAEPNNILIWRSLHKRAFSQIRDIYKVVMDVLSNASPEGNVPASFQDMEENIEELIASVDLDGNISGGSNNNGNEGKGSKHQLILHQCFRAIKESCTLLSVLISKTPLPETRESQECYLTFEDVVIGGEFCRLLLTTIRHRGAFSSVYECFSIICNTLLNCRKSFLIELPKQWLVEMVDSIVKMDISITRRSAGLPLYILSILTSNHQSRKKLVTFVMDRLFQIARMPIENGCDEKLDLPQVHAFNIIRAIVSDSTLNETVLDYVADMFMLVIDGFSSPIFPIRNCSMMLFSSILNRALGVKKSRDEEDAVNTITGNEFFSRFPRLHPYLLEKLSMAVGDLKQDSMDVSPVLYPILTILARLKSSFMDGSKSLLSLRPFKSLVVRCSNTAIYNARQMSARALSSLVPTNELLNMVEMLLLSLKDECVSKNQYHGTLLQVHHLLKSHARSLPLSDQKSLVKLLNDCLMPLRDSMNLCNLNAAVYLKIVHDFLLLNDWICVMEGDTLKLGEASDNLIESLVSIGKNVLTSKDVCANIGSYYARQQWGALLLEYAFVSKSNVYIEDTISLLLSNDSDYEIQLHTIVALKSRLNFVVTRINVDCLAQMLIDMIVSRPTVYTRCVNSACDLLAELFLIAQFDATTVTRVLNLCDIIVPRIAVTRNPAFIESALPLLASVQSILTKEIEHLNSFFRFAHRFMDESQPVSVREAVISSLKTFIRSAHILSRRHELELLHTFRTLLQDDDVDLRDAMALVVSDCFKLDTPVIAIRALELVVGAQSKLFSPATNDILVDFITRVFLPHLQSLPSVVSNELKVTTQLFQREPLNMYYERIHAAQLDCIWLYPRLPEYPQVIEAIAHVWEEIFDLLFKESDLELLTVRPSIFAVLFELILMTRETGCHSVYLTRLQQHESQLYWMLRHAMHQNVRDSLFLLSPSVLNQEIV